MGTHPIFESDFDCLTEESNLSKDLDTLVVSRRAPRLVSLISNFLVKELADFAPNKRALLGTSSNNSRTVNSPGQRNTKTSSGNEKNRSQRGERGRGRNSRSGRIPKDSQKIDENSSSATVEKRSVQRRGGGGANRPAAKATFSPST